jgi:arylsulfatase A-like enzyme
VTPQKGWQEGDRKTYAAMVESMDAAVGRIVEEVDRLGLDEKTLIVFTSDNGGAKFARNAPCSKGKGTLWEGGIRVPGIVRWTGTLPAGKVSGQVVATFDWTRTILELAGGEAPADRPPDGINLLKPLRRGEAVKRTLFWRRRVEPIRKNVDPHRAVRHGRWKYIDRPDGTQYVYDLSRDVGETQNLIDAHADRAAHLKKLLDAWEADLDPPLYDQRAASLAAQRRAKAARSDK